MKTTKTTSKQLNILYLEGDKGLIRDMKDYIKFNELKEKKGLNFIYAENCKEALKKLAEFKVDLIIMEILLPIINGYYFLDALNSQEEKIPVIIYTRLKGPQDLAKMAAYGVDNIFIKQLMKMEDMIGMIMTRGAEKVEIDRVLLELQSQIRALSDSQVQVGQSKIVQCPKCNMILPRGSHFCNNCGQKIATKEKKLTVRPSGKEDTKNTKPSAEEPAVPETLKSEKPEQK